MKSIKAVETSFYAKRGSGKTIIILFMCSYFFFIYERQSVGGYGLPAILTSYYM